MGDPVNGQTLYGSNGCSGCHGTGANQGVYPINPTDMTFNYQANGPHTLIEVIDLYMPTYGANLCTGECAEDIAAYIESWAQ